MATGPRLSPARRAGEVDPATALADEAAVLVQHPGAARGLSGGPELDRALGVEQAAAGPAQDLQPRPLLAPVGVQRWGGRVLECQLRDR